jgi:trehalose-6-phosphate hydrolase
MWCYQREWQGQRLLVIANLSDTFQNWQPVQADGNWQVLMHNYAEVASQPGDMTLRPFEAVWWVQK